MTTKQNLRECYDAEVMKAQSKVGTAASEWRKIQKEWECLSEIASHTKHGKSSKAISALTYTEAQIESNHQNFDRNLFELEEKHKAEIIALRAKHQAAIQALKDKRDRYEEYLVKQKEQKQKELREAASALTPAQVRCKAKATDIFQAYKDAILRFRKDFPDDARLVNNPPQMPEWLISTGSTPDNLSTEEQPQPVKAPSLKEFFGAPKPQPQPAAAGGGATRRLPPPIPPSDSDDEFEVDWRRVKDDDPEYLKLIEENGGVGMTMPQEFKCFKIRIANKRGWTC